MWKETMILIALPSNHFHRRFRQQFPRPHLPELLTGRYEGNKESYKDIIKIMINVIVALVLVAIR